MLRNIFLIFVFVVMSLIAHSQKATLKGNISDINTKETMVGVNVIIDNASTGVASDIDGNYSIQLEPGRYKVTYRYIGYSSKVKFINLKSGETEVDDIKMKPESKELDAVVVSAGKFEQKISDVTISMAVIKPATIENSNTTDLRTVINKVPGVNIIEDQPNIRGGSGWSYGSGSRVLLLIDDLPLSSPNAGDTKWQFLPVENISQVEVIKGASSSMYGSSAMNGVINVRTAYPGNQPLTKFSIFTGFYMNPPRSEMKWWGNQNPIFTGASALHSRKIKNLDLVTGINAFVNAGYRENNNEQRLRYNLNLRYKLSKKINIYAGVNSNIQYENRKGYFLWVDKDSGIYRQPMNTVNELTNYRITVDPFIEYFAKNGVKRSLKTRYYISNANTKNITYRNKGQSWFAQYNYFKPYNNKTSISSGASFLYMNTEAQLLGIHHSMNAAVYTQLDKKFFDRISLSFGIRGEAYRLDNDEIIVQPVIRSGLNVQITKYTFARASFGQGYRYPSIPEKYTQAQVDILTIFPSPNVQPEHGWTAEVGLRQGVQIGKFNGFVDIAGFWMEYKNMMEFTFNSYDTVTYLPSTNPGSKPGFQTQNVSNARIYGVDIAFLGQGKILGVNTTVSAGYTYSNPVVLGNDSIYNLTKSTDDPILKYRFHHSVKIDVEFAYKKFSTGLNFMYNSNMVNIDAFLEAGLVMKGLKEYRIEHNKGYSLFDWRISYKLGNESKIAVIVNNLFNAEVMWRPGDVSAPRNIALQYSLSF